MKKKKKRKKSLIIFLEFAKFNNYFCRIRMGLLFFKIFRVVYLGTSFSIFLRKESNSEIGNVTDFVLIFTGVTLLNDMKVEL